MIRRPLVLKLYCSTAMRKIIALGLGLLFSTFFYRSQCVQRSCPFLAAQKGDPGALDTSHFAAYIDTHDIPGKGADLKSVAGYTCSRISYS